jgi:hypothetical protein
MDKPCQHGTLARAKTGGWFCISRGDCDFSIPEPRPTPQASNDVPDWGAVVTEMGERFTSGNAVPVERAMIRRVEWESVLQRLHEALPDETTTPRTLSATERLHNICDALSEQADESPYTREEWERIDAQTVAVQNAARALLDKMDQVRSTPYHAPQWEKEFNALRALVGKVKPLPVKTSPEGSL